MGQVRNGQIKMKVWVVVCSVRLEWVYIYIWLVGISDGARLYDLIIKLSSSHAANLPRHLPLFNGTS